MRPLHQFTIASEIPDELGDLSALAANLHWAWDRRLAAVFDRVDEAPPEESWRRTGRHPYDLVTHTSPQRWAELAGDAAFVADVGLAADRLREAIAGPSWFGDRSESPLGSVAYFSPEFGITEAVPQYSGGLGVLAGDHLKASSDLGVPLIGVGLFYAEGYFHQYLDGDGWQHERNPRVDPGELGLTDTGVTVEVDLAGTAATIRVWRVDVGRVPLYLLDTNVDGNPAEVVAVTNRLYGGDEQHRLRQEIVLGIGGVRALRALGVDVEVFHMNEGHAGFLGLERMREWMARGLSFPEAIEAVRAGGVFTTHTPVPAGIDRFPRPLFETYFSSFAEEMGVDFDELFALGQRADEPDGKFNMAVMGLRLAARRNGVARLHGAVSREMFSGMWPAIDPSDVPIAHVTNGVHARSWVADRVDELLSDRVGESWHLAGEDDFARVWDIDAHAIAETRRRGRAELVGLVRDRLGDDLLDPDVLTIGFARRFATYKRATLLLSQPERLRAMLTDPDRPVQFVFAGKAHPADEPGKSLIQAIVDFTRDAGVRRRFVFLPDYDIGVARTMYHGCDVWLNTPRRPMEACGTSGMKAALNGVLNCSILDGWWDEMTTGDNGFDLPSFDDEPDADRRDQREASAAFEVLERDVIPMFYERGDDGVPHRWVDRIKRNWATLGWQVTAARMVRDYTRELYEPAAEAGAAVTAQDAATARDLAAWRRGVASVWDQVHVEVLDASRLDDGVAGEPRSVVVAVDPGSLQADELVVQAVHGPVDRDGTIDRARSTTVELVRADDVDGRLGYRGEIVPAGPGAWGLTVRALPTHAGLSSIYETGLVSLG